MRKLKNVLSVDCDCLSQINDNKFLIIINNNKVVIYNKEISFLLSKLQNKIFCVKKKRTNKKILVVSKKKYSFFLFSKNNIKTFAHPKSGIIVLLIPIYNKLK